MKPNTQDKDLAKKLLERAKTSENSARAHENAARALEDAARQLREAAAVLMDSAGAMPNGAVAKRVTRTSHAARRLGDGSKSREKTAKARKLTGRRGDMVAFLRRHPGSTRQEVLKATGMPAGSFDSLITIDKDIFFKDDRRGWHVREEALETGH